MSFSDFTPALAANDPVREAWFRRGDVVACEVLLTTDESALLVAKRAARTRGT